MLYYVVVLSLYHVTLFKKYTVLYYSILRLCYTIFYNCAFYIVLFYITLYYGIVYCIMFNYTILYCTILYYIILYRIIFYDFFDIML